MRRYSSYSGSAGWGGILIMLGVAIAVIVGLAIWTDRSMDYLLTWIKGVPVDCPMWLSTLISIVGNAFIVAFNLIMEVIRMVR